MGRIQNKLTEYDLAVRALDRERFDRDYKVKQYYDVPNIALKEKRKHLIRKLKYYRHPEHMEQYHSRFLKIQTKLHGIINFDWKPAQRVLYNDYVLPQILANKPVRIYILKARQIGFSTQIEGLATAFCSLFSDFRSTVVAHDMYTSGEVFRMCKLFYKSLPKDFKPARKISNRKELELANPREDGDLGLESKFTVNTANNPHLGAGTTLRFIHLSEFARYEEVNSNIHDTLTALYQTIPELPGTFIFKETTAYGEGLGKTDWEQTDDGFEKVFISWIADEDYRLDEYILDSEIQYDERDKYGNELLARENVIKELKKWCPEHKDDLHWLQQESLHRLAWRRWYIDKKCFGKVDLFQQEYPSTPEESFRLTGKSVFNTYNLILQKQKAEVIAPNIPRYSYIFHGKRDKLGQFEKDSIGPLKIFSLPESEKRYFVGVDIGSGVKDGDYSVAQIFNTNYEQVAVYRDIIEPDQLAYPVVTLAMMYNSAKIIPEANAMGVSTIARILKDLSYGNMYIRKKINSVDGSITNEWGFYTSRRTRPTLINNLRQLISSSKLKLFDFETISEFLSFVFVDKNGTLHMQATQGMHDDCVMSVGLACIDIPKEQDMEISRNHIPYGSIEYHARRMDRSLKQNTNFGSVIGI